MIVTDFLLINYSCILQYFIELINLSSIVLLGKLKENAIINRYGGKVLVKANRKSDRQMKGKPIAPRARIDDHDHSPGDALRKLSKRTGL